MMVLGLDIGSTWTEAVLLEGGKALSFKVLPPGGDFRRAGLRAVRAVTRGQGVDLRGLRGIVVTGYGREAFPEGEKVTELRCQALGVWKLMPSVRTVIDVGGQDTKVILVGEGGSCWALR